MADGKVVISTALDNSGIEKDAGKLRGALGGAVKSVAGTLGGLAKVAGAASSAIIGAFSAAAIAIGKQSVDAYADYEQLVGGVETLFKDSADKVIDYAEDAFYTVGLSANEYMQTVTSFSASLISSMGGDTSKAADVANMALVDMADNANKMGNSLESVKETYKSLAKGQYQLLDNLALGYGGDKTGMEQLLKDAQAITGVKYDINNLSDVYSAIHAIQEKMGIAGTTAKEAEKTISGSAAMTAAAWKNVLAAISGGGDIDRAINNLVYSVTKYFDNIVPVVQKAISGIGTLIGQIAPLLVQTIAMELIMAIPDLISAIFQMITGAAKGIYQGIAALFAGETAELTKQLNVDSSGLDGAAGGFDAVADSAENAEEAAKKAKKSLAGFDEITKLGGKDEAAGATDMSASMSAATIPAEMELTGLDKAEKKIPAFITKLKKLFEPLGKSLANFFAPLGEDAQFIWDNTLKPFGDWLETRLVPLLVNSLAEGIDSVGASFDAVRGPLQEFWQNTLKPIFAQIGTWIEKIVKQTTDSFGYFSEKVAKYKDEIAMVIEGIGAALQIIWSVISPILGSVVDGIGNVLSTAIDFVFSIIRALGNLFSTIKNVFNGIVEFCKGNTEEATAYFRQAWGNFVNIWVGIGNAIVAVLNNLWNLVFDSVKGSVNALGGLVEKIGEFAGLDWGWHWDAAAPLIPEIPKYVPALARGAVLPPNKPFMAVVGDQRHGTNIEAPLDTIREAVALELADLVASNMAGHEATVEVLREILEAVLGIRIGDEVLGKAVARYNAKMATIQGVCR